MKNELNDFKEFMKKREIAAGAYVTGDAEPLGQVVTNVSPSTFFGPGGGYVDGAEEVYDRYKNDAKHFDSGSSNNLEIIQMEASNGLAYWVGFQHANVYMKGQKEAVPMSLRITEVFRKEDNEWKMVHRHADSLVKEEKKTKS